MSNLAAYAHLLASGAAVTLGLAAASLMIGLVLGLGLAAAKLSRHRWLAAAVTAIADFIRGIPEFLVLLIIYFGGTKLLSDLTGDYVEVSPWSAGVAALSIVGLDDLMRRSKQASETTKEPFTFFLAAATIYLAITIVSMIVVAAVERRSSRFLERA